MQNNHHYFNNHNNSISIVNVLDELNNNKKEISSDDKNKNNFIMYSEVKEISKSILEKSKITVKRRDNNITNCNFDNRAHINSYYIINRSHNNNTVEPEHDETLNKNNNNATIKSQVSAEDKEFRQDLIFYGVKPIPYKDLSLITHGKLSQCIFGEVALPLFDQDNQLLNTRTIIYHDEVDDKKVEWRKLNVCNTNKNKIVQGSAKNCSVVVALISIYNYDVIFEKKLLKSIVNIISQDKVDIKIYFNGAERKLEINDYFPYTGMSSQNIFSNSFDPNINLIESWIMIYCKYYSRLNICMYLHMHIHNIHMDGIYDTRTNLKQEVT